MRDAALEGLGRGMPFCVARQGTVEGGVTLMLDAVPRVRQRIIWVKDTQRTVGFIGAIRIELLGEFDTLTVGSNTRQIPAFQNIAIIANKNVW
jgi:hypothetical protein